MQGSQLEFVIGFKLRVDPSHVIRDAEDALIAALKVKIEHPSALITMSAGETKGVTHVTLHIDRPPARIVERMFLRYPECASDEGHRVRWDGRRHERSGAHGTGPLAVLVLNQGYNPPPIDSTCGPSGPIG